MSVTRAVVVTVSMAVAFLALVAVLRAWNDPFLVYVLALAHVVAAVGLGLEGVGVESTRRRA